MEAEHDLFSKDALMELDFPVKCEISSNDVLPPIYFTFQNVKEVTHFCSFINLQVVFGGAEQELAKAETCCASSFLCGKVWFLILLIKNTKSGWHHVSSKIYRVALARKMKK